VASTLLAVGSLALAWRRYGAARLVVAAVLAAPALIAPAWMLVLSNHSQIHDVFVYRTVPVSIGIALGACLVAARVSDDRPGVADRG
jgi:peptidoglycan/LPS O-acetylase OafA/YrhL